MEKPVISADLGELDAQEAVTYLTGLFQAFTHTAGFVITNGGIDAFNAMEKTVLDELAREYKTTGGTGHPEAPKKDAASMVKMAFGMVRKAYGK